MEKPVNAIGVNTNGDSQVNKGKTYKNAREYAQALRPWLVHYQTCCAMQSFAQSSALHQIHAMSMIPQSSSHPFYDRYTNTTARRRIDPYAQRRVNNGQNGGTPHAPQAQEMGPDRQGQTEPEGTLYKVPTFWKRVAAEMLDFTLLFYIKMLVSISLITDFTNFDTVSRAQLMEELWTVVGSEEIFDTFNEMDYNRAFAITFEVIALEIINRIVITIFETMCLYRARVRGVPVGATPGKRLLGLKVVSCDHVRSVGNNQVIVYPAGSISLKNAFLRSVIKNFTIAFFLPACLTLFFFKHNRTAYDVVAHTIVVEDV